MLRVLYTSPLSDPNPNSPTLHPQSVLLNLVLAVVLEGASDQMKEKHAAQQFRDNTLRLFHNQYKRLTLRRWSAKIRADIMLERGTHGMRYSSSCKAVVDHSTHSNVRPP